MSVSLVKKINTLSTVILQTLINKSIGENKLFNSIVISVKSPSNDLHITKFKLDEEIETYISIDGELIISLDANKNVETNKFTKAEIDAISLKEYGGENVKLQGTMPVISGESIEKVSKKKKKKKNKDKKKKKIKRIDDGSL